MFSCFLTEPFPFTQYYEAVYLMRRYMERLPMDSSSNSQIKQLLAEKAEHYEQVASKLMNDDSSSVCADNISALTFSPRSPLSTTSINTRLEAQRFFPDDSSSVPKQQPRGSSCRSKNSEAIDTIAGQANTKLANALDLDESGKTDSAVSAYMEAAELYLQAIQLCKNEQQKTRVGDALKRRLQQTLDRVEELKHPKQQQHTVRESDKSQQTQDHQSLTSEEIKILKRSSLIASGLFLPWCDRDAQMLAAECARSSSFALFTDPDGYLPLSSKQKQRFHRWARPSEILRLRQQYAVLGSVLKPLAGKPVIVKAITPYTIQQKYVTDCSFIASLCICATFERRFRKRLITSILYPQDANGELMYNPAGKYMVKLWLNGVARCVVIDDYLPIDKHGNLLCSQTTNNSASSLELWVCLIEKAYMKLCGGYDFPGSNSGVDLFSLTGWIPERILFAKDPENVKDFETPADRAWERIFSASSYGDCLITVSTQLELTEMEADTIGLVTGHAYAVLAVIQTKNGTRLLQLKNPWAHQSWNGRFSCHDKDNWGSHSFRQEVGYNPDIAAKQDDGVFWICWEDILHYFQNFHLSWNPSLFRSRLTIHGCWPKDQGPSDDTFNIGENPQYTLTLSDKAIYQKATIWILISRHVTKQEQEGSEVSGSN
jgi:calpain-7